MNMILNRGLTGLTQPKIESSNFLFNISHDAKRNPFARSLSGMFGKAPGVGGGIPHVRPHGEDYGVQKGCAREKL